MQKIISNKNGVSLLEIIVSVTFVSICLILIYNMLGVNIRQNAINQEKSINANIANGALNYIKNENFDEIRAFLDSNNNGNYAIINVNNCCDLFNDDSDICLSVLSPTINNKKYNSDNLNIYLIPYNDPIRIDQIKMTPPVVFPDVLNQYIYDIDTTSFNVNNINNNVIRVVVVVKSDINEKYDFLLEGVTTND